MMKGFTIAAGVLAAALLVSAPAVQAQNPKDCPRGAPERVEGQVVKIDAASNKVTVQETNGTMHEFTASRETIQDMKVGEKITAKLRVAPDCKKS